MIDDSERNRKGCLAVPIQACIREVLGSNLGRNTEYLEVFRGFSRALQANFGIVLPLGHEQFLPNPFLFITNRSSHHSTLS
jgi:hypothetical protein